MITIIVPIFNSENFLEKCLESILAQTYKDLEIILVNDGSNDRSKDICNAYAKIDSRIKLIHKNNEGVSAARNDALKVAKGEYVGFVDSDDWIDPKMYENLYKLIRSTDSDISVCGYKTRLNSSINGKIDYFTIEDNKEKINILIKNNQVGGYLWNKLFSMDIIKKNGISLFDENIYFCEDLLYTSQLFMESKSVSVTTASYYNYITHGNNSTSYTYSKSKLTALLALQQIIDKFQDSINGGLELYKDLFMHINISLLMNGMKQKKLDKKTTLYLKKNLFRYNLLDLKSYKIKLSCLICRINLRLHYIIWNNFYGK
ncbi:MULTISPECIES: glycosyltransferase [Carnobacterium]|uniref:glycosyltransferase n=1 Tax=Carnobacterium TaxID=2747 RepID=UPI0028908CD2|nr:MULTISPECIES: glycosyltransferase [Carnobacterium]MDT1940063.1 glycosyltransferase [Carnobacterium divergens]MDT1942501.1 glycosyltransferase [Carnobacterium divergens]MDT1948307.1 glycosyltransferase [Carnobacterium divergens]MDT1950787.1 glycosyltransferase [Carnobacterium divergens]MDT1956067.1 glycosyltransferase [Carnobacterium divergens]